MEKFFDLKVFGSVAILLLVLYAIMYFTKPDATKPATPATTTATA